MTSPQPLDVRALARRCQAFAQARDGQALALLVADFVGFFAALGWAAAAIGEGRWALAAPGQLLAVVMLLRLFVTQHDCGHGSRFSARWANTAAGRLISVFTLAPYGFWRAAHNLHHATTGDLERGGVGDVFTLSVAQYLALDEHDRRRYRRFRDTRLMILLGSPLQFMVRYRLPWVLPLPLRQVWRSVLGLNLALLVVYGLASLALGPGVVALTALPVLTVSIWVGGWMFYMQHQFEHTHWRRHADWDFYEASLWASSHYDLPRLLHWCTGDVGLHHIHHLCPGVPCYRLRECMEAIPELADVNRIGLRESLRCARLALWDEDGQRLLSFEEARRAALIP